MKELSKAYEAKKYEDMIYKRWEESGFFNPDVCVAANVIQKGASYFSMVLPPPNVTGTLHMGHAAMLAIEDVMVRYHRMKGDRTLWVPGTDHAAVATESKVEAKLIKEEGFQKPKQELGREKFLEHVEQFAKDSHDTIVDQCKKMGASLDWSREAYTLDEQRSLAVRSVFKKMYEDGLIYRGYRVVNWSVKGQSTCSDDELVYVERPAKLYYFKYSKDFPITIATTRPETKLGDTAVAVNPKDTRYKKYIGKTFTVDVGALKPLNIKIIAQDEVDPNFGTGAVGVTPAHSMADFAMYEKQKAQNDPIELIQVIGEDGRMTPAAGTEYVGKTAEQAREKFVQFLKQQNLLEKEEDITQNVGTSDRFGDVVEVLPKMQWFVDVHKKFKSNFSNKEMSLKEIMQKVVKNGDIKIIPDRFEKTYFNWIDNLRDWCISRQIWFGHQIPAYYEITDEQNFYGFLFFHGENGFIEVGSSLEKELSSIGKYPPSIFSAVPKGEDSLHRFITSLSFGQARFLVEVKGYAWEEIKQKVTYVDVALCKNFFVPKNDEVISKFAIQDPDTLDTWFSSGLWTFSTLLTKDFKKYKNFEEWLDNSPDFKNFHPNSILETGYDILFFWVARMILMTTYTLGTVPFKTVYLHGLVRDEKGRKMSKSLENIINPLDMIEKYGTDATRLSLLLGNAPGNDMKLSEEKIAGFRNFTNKLWNISRFMLQKIDNPQIDIKKPNAKTISDHWILWHLDSLVFNTNKRLNKYEFSYAGELLKAFTWNELADWYLEIAKREGDKSEILNYILNTLLKLWHPYMPYVTETIWSEMYGNFSILMVQKFPQVDSPVEPNENVLVFENILKPIILAIRSFREENKVEVGYKINIFITTGSQFELINNNKNMIADPRIKIANLIIEQKIDDLKNKYLIWSRVGIEIYTDYSPDSDKEKTRLTKELEEAKKYLNTLEKKLSNEEFIKNAPEVVVNVEKEKLKLQQEKVQKLQNQLTSLQS